MARSVRHVAIGLVVGSMAFGLAITSRAAADTPALAASSTSAYLPIEPYRLADTRATECGCRRIDASTIGIDLTGRPGVPDEIVAAVITITAGPATSAGYVTAFPGGTSRPVASTLNTLADGYVSNSAIVPVGADHSIAIYQRSAGDVIVDITGVFVPAAESAGGRFVPVPARRLLDTREPGPAAGPLRANGERTVPLPNGVPGDAVALAVTVSSVAATRPGYLSARPAGTPRRTTALTTVDGTGRAVSTATVIPVSADGFTIRSKSGGHVIVDVVGWFTGPSTPPAANGLFVPLGPQRLHDTRLTGPRAWPGGTIEVPVAIADAASLVTNVAITRADRRGYVTAYPARTARPGTATLSAAFFDHTIANMAITRVSTRGLAYFAYGGADLVVDVTGYFVGSPVATTTSKQSNAVPRSRVDIVGDSTLAGLAVVTEAQVALQGLDAIVDGASCRRLLRPSCRSSVTGVVPNTAVEAITGVPGRVDVVVVKTGYNDWFSDFPTEFDAVVQAARARGAHTIIWLSYNETVARSNARQAYRENNDDLRRLVLLPQYSDVLLADWFRYSDLRQDWFFDGTHLTRTGAYALADYVSRWVAAIEHRPCPQPWTPGGPVPNPCPVPDLIGPVPDPVGLY